MWESSFETKRAECDGLYILLGKSMRLNSDIKIILKL